MNNVQHGLKVFEEELGEFAMEILSLQQQVSKAIRFGIDECRDLPTSNRERIQAEWNDVLGTIEHLAKIGVDLRPDMTQIAKKMAKIEKYGRYSKELGMVKDDDVRTAD